jgi:hypothetical protein
MNNVKWNYNSCKEESLKYKTRMDFKKNSPSAYSKCVKDWPELLLHMEEKRKPKGYWTYEKCKELASYCKARQEFFNKKGFAYEIARKNGWLDDICSHMDILGNLKKRCIYAYEFDDNYVYVGLTFNFEKRWITRLNDINDAVKKHIDKTGKYPIRKKLTDYVDIKMAVNLESEILRKYLEEGWNVLNRNKTGSLGGDHRVWTYEICKQEALKYDSLDEFRKQNNNCLSAIYKSNWKELLDHLKYTKKSNGFWNKDNCNEFAKLCKSRKEFSLKYRGAYMSSLKNEWLDEFFR